MPRFIIACTATATIRETWSVEAETEDRAREILTSGWYGDEHEAPSAVTFIRDEVIGGEEDREIVTCDEQQAGASTEATNQGAPIR